MAAVHITRAHLKSAVETQNWDLLDKLLEMDRKHIDVASYFTDTWGEWWGLLMECVFQNYESGVRILLKHGADRTVGTWGDCTAQSPLEAAAGKPELLALLQSKSKPAYIRKIDPSLPAQDAGDRRVTRQGDISEDTGMVFQVDEL